MAVNLRFLDRFHALRGNAVIGALRLRRDAERPRLVPTQSVGTINAVPVGLRCAQRQPTRSQAGLRTEIAQARLHRVRCGTGCFRGRPDLGAML